jgi:glutathione S-transferase
MIRLITIRFSHYCEKARWALDRGRIAYEERSHLPLFAWFPALAGGHHRTVPVLVGDGERLPDSTDILKWVDRRAGNLHLDDPDVAALEDEFDLVLGPASRRLAYYESMKSPERMVDLFTGAAPPWQVTLSRYIQPLMFKTLRYGLRIDEAGVARSRKAIDEIFSRVEARIADGRKYLAGDRFSAADLTFASLAQPILHAPAYQRFTLPESQFPPQVRVMVDRYRATAAGKFALRLYEER